jgi:hypothetical protein
MMASTRIWPKILSFLLSALLALVISSSSSSSDSSNDDVPSKRQGDHAADHSHQHHLHEHRPNPTSAKSTADKIIECGVYLAPSSIPGSGLGMYAGNRTFQENDIVTDEDIVIPIFEREWHSNVKGKFLWDEYIWNGDVSGWREGKREQRIVLSLGCWNCFDDECLMTIVHFHYH